MFCIISILILSKVQEISTACTLFDNLYNMQTPPTTVQHTFDLTQDLAIGIWVRFIPTSDTSFSTITEGYEASVVFAIKNPLSDTYRIALVTTTDRLNKFQGFRFYIYANAW